MKKLLCLLSLFLVSAVCTESARADHGLGFGLGYVYGQGYGFGNGRNNVIVPYTPPYFSLHPPVYYGKRYTRPYGASPFAAWPQLQANSSYSPQPHVDREQIIANPYVPCAADCTCGNCLASSTDGKRRAAQERVVTQKPVKPLIIENPYYQPSVQYTSKFEGKVD